MEGIHRKRGRLGSPLSSPTTTRAVGIAFIITNNYKGDDALASPQFDGKKWEKCLGDLRFDVRSKSYMSEENMIAFLKAHTHESIPIRGPDCHYVIFVFSGHVRKVFCIHKMMT